LSPDVLTNDDSARFRRLLNTRRHIDAVTIEIAIGAHRDICDMDADPQIVRMAGSR
jgi:hypothetical protein